MRLVLGGTDNLLILGDLTPLGVTRRQAEQVLEGVGIIANKNAIPYAPRPPCVPSGLRLGTRPFSAVLRAPLKQPAWALRCAC